MRGCCLGREESLSSTFYVSYILYELLSMANLVIMHTLPIKVMMKDSIQKSPNIAYQIVDPRRYLSRRIESFQNFLCVAFNT